MSKLITKLTDIWIDLEVSYAKLSVTLNCTTRREFLDKIARTNTNDSAIPQLLSALSAEQTKIEYDQHDLESLGVIRQIFDTVDHLYSNNLVPDEIDNLNQLVSISPQSKISDFTLTKEDIYSLFNFNPMSIGDTPKDMFERYGMFENFVDSNGIAHHVVDTYKDDFFILHYLKLNKDLEIPEGSLVRKALSSKQFIADLQTAYAKKKMVPELQAVVSNSLYKNRKILGHKVRKILELESLIVVKSKERFLYVVKDI